MLVIKTACSGADRRAISLLSPTSPSSTRTPRSSQEEEEVEVEEEEGNVGPYQHSIVALASTSRGAVINMAALAVEGRRAGQEHQEDTSPHRK